MNEHFSCDFLNLMQAGADPGFSESVFRQYSTYIIYMQMVLQIFNRSFFHKKTCGKNIDWVQPNHQNHPWICPTCECSRETWFNFHWPYLDILISFLWLSINLQCQNDVNVKSDLISFLYSSLQISVMSVLELTSQDLNFVLCCSIKIKQAICLK